ncbi:hypothetical protein E7V67_006780 [[Empedobacter] haloabium]|uniref:AlgX/AlgJ SGNH hydrolase-like domain-containing protein n=1 Tax=[Empedobacter] haloabium TaxID=592317 RepID=A0ABZ1UPX6_9BURK
MRFILSVLGGVVLAALGLEATLQCLPVHSGVRMAQSSAATPYAHYLPGQSYVYSHGWALANMQRGTTSRDGFVHSKDIAAGANVLVTGDSFIESYMLRYEDTVQGRLDTALGKVYAPASSGNGLADALVLARHFLPLTHAKTMVVFVEPFDLRLIEYPAGRGHNYFGFDDGKVDIRHMPYVESNLKEKVLRSALLRYAYYNLKLPDWASGKVKPAEAASDNSTALAQHRARRDAALDYFFAELGKLQQQYGTRFVFLVDGDREAIYSQGKKTTWPAEDRAALLARLRTGGYAVADMQPVFERHWATYGERMDFLPMDGHWNRVAHALAAKELLPLLAK